jgi:hypothetical protein
MKRNANALLILLFVFLLVVGLNFAFFVEERSAEENEEKPFTELRPGDPGSLLLISLPSTNPINDQESESLNKWIDAGGLLIVIDRDVHLPIGDANVQTESGSGTQNVRVYQPTNLTRGVDNVSLSDVATRVRINSRSVTEHIGDNQAAVLADVNWPWRRVDGVLQGNSVAGDVLAGSPGWRTGGLHARTPIRASDPA